MRLCNNTILAAFLTAAVLTARAQETPSPSTPAQAAPLTVVLPVTVTDRKGLPATGLAQENFQIFETNIPQQIASLGVMDAPASIGILLDLSGSMTSKLNPAREAIVRFLKASNPRDEFFVVGFKEHAELIEDFTNSVEDIQSRLAMVRCGHRTALYDAIDYGLAKMKEARYERKALLVISDGGDNTSKHSEAEVRAQVLKSDVEIYSIGIFDPYAPTPEERAGPMLLDELSEESGGWLFRVEDLAQMGAMAERISMELRSQYVIGFRPHNLTHDGKWRKVKVKVNPPPGFPSLTVHARTGYYAPLQ